MLEERVEKFIRDYDYFEPYGPDNICKIITKFVQEELTEKEKQLSEEV